MDKAKRGGIAAGRGTAAGRGGKATGAAGSSGAGASTSGAAAGGSKPSGGPGRGSSLAARGGVSKRGKGRGGGGAAAAADGGCPISAAWAFVAANRVWACIVTRMTCLAKALPTLGLITLSGPIKSSTLSAKPLNLLALSC